MQMMQMILVSGEKREGICGVISNPCKLYSYTLTFEQVMTDGDYDADDTDDADDTGVGGEEGGICGVISNRAPVDPFLLNHCTCLPTDIPIYQNIFLFQEICKNI